MEDYKGNYEDFLQYRERRSIESVPAQEDFTEKASDAKIEYESTKQARAAERKRLRDLERTESEIEQAEQKLAEIDKALSAPEYASDPVKLTDLLEEREACQTQLEELMNLWTSLSEAIEEEGTP